MGRKGASEREREIKRVTSINDHYSRHAQQKKQKNSYVESILNTAHTHTAHFQVNDNWCAVSTMHS